MRRIIGIGVTLLVLVAAVVVGMRHLVPEPDLGALIGAYRTRDGGVVVLTDLGDGCLGYDLPDGAYGSACGSDGVFADGEARVTADGSDVSIKAGGATVSATRVVAEAVPARFASGELDLAGELLVPPGEDVVPLAIMVQGSSASSALRVNWERHVLSAQGIATFAYDKRGTGLSDGQYTQDFDLLAADAAAAMAEARRLLGDRTGAAGFVGFSQGGWVGPYAATMVPADFVVVAYGMAVPPAEEERVTIMEQMAAAGHGEPVVETAGELASEAVALASRGFGEPWDGFSAITEAAEKEGWLGDLPEGSLTQAVSRFPMWITAMIWPFFDDQTSWYYPAEEVLRSLDLPQLWLLGELDESTPIGGTVEILEAMQVEGFPVTLQIFPGAGHGMVMKDAEGTRLNRVAEGYMARIVDFVTLQ
ncbi:alpha/beta hydrolase family protein [Aestuariibius sp. 2305UL40-4]|uniref:alpha/beta hydrolase family protein n=1 Tax=Aestuariibius violaceus TaxID=3234132 RepID=UPI00345E6A04